ncbi:divalent metal cation transporter [Patescibacteria group bacterium]|nr:divalent metal cation transporter [Patescibacteria group bacterium]MCL5091847.1 divalent metal cation transporter [Patescibacteria group bacterium]
MWERLKSHKQIQRLLVFLAVFGPATITAMADNDGAGVATYSLAGARFGYSILFILLLVTVLLAITQEMGVRIATVTGKGLGDLIRERYGVVISTFVFLGLLAANIGTIVADFAAIKATATIFSIPVLPIIIGVVATAYVFVIRGNYRINQRIFLLASLFYLCYIVSAVKAGPDWGLALKSLVVPTGISLSRDFIFAAIAVLGTTITPWGQFFVHSFIIDKKLAPDKLNYEQFETMIGAFLTDFFSFFMIVATAATLFANKIVLVTGEQASLAIRPFAGELAGILFGLGILNAGFMGVVIVSLSTAYAFSEFFGNEGSLDVPFEKGRTFYSIFLTQLFIAALIVIIPSVSLFKIVFYTQAFNGILLPFMFYFLLRFTNDRSLMGKHVNHRWYNYFAIVASIVIIGAALFTVISAYI